MEETVSTRVHRLSLVSMFLGFISLAVQLLLFIGLMNIDFPVVVSTFIVPILIILTVITAPTAFIVGVIALKKIKKSQTTKSRGLAIIGISCGTEFLLVVILALIFWEHIITYA